MSLTIGVTIAVAPEVAEALFDIRNREAIGRLTTTRAYPSAI
jgi:hypothetical protein